MSLPRPGTYAGVIFLDPGTYSLQLRLDNTTPRTISFTLTSNLTPEGLAVAYTPSMCQPLLKSAVRNSGGTRSSFAARHNKLAGRDIAT